MFAVLSASVARNDRNSEEKRGLTVWRAKNIETQLRSLCVKMPCAVESEWRILTAHSIETPRMFLRTVKVKRADGHIDEYVRLVESVWRKGRPEHRVISNLGRKDLLAPHADTLRRILTGEQRPRPQADAVGAWDWGPLLVARHLWR